MTTLFPNKHMHTQTPETEDRFIIVLCTKSGIEMSRKTASHTYITDCDRRRTPTLIFVRDMFRKGTSDFVIAGVRISLAPHPFRKARAKVASPSIDRPQKLVELARTLRWISELQN